MKKSTNYPDIAIHMMFFFKVALLQNLISSFKDSFVYHIHMSCNNSFGIY